MTRRSEKEEERRPLISRDENQKLVVNPLESQRSEAKSVSFFSLWRFASNLDIFCILIGFLTSIATGVVGPLQIFVFGGAVIDFNVALQNPTTENLLHQLLPTILHIVYLGIAMFLGGYISQAMWIYTGENQTKRIRVHYVRSILKQDNAWFDKGEEGSLSTRLASDTQLVQEAISEKMGATLQSVAQFVAGLSVAFWQGWRLSLVILGCVPVLIGVGGLTVFLINKFMTASQDAYAEAGLIAEQAIGGIRTVHSFSLQERFSKRYQILIEKAKRSNIKSGVAIALGFGTLVLFLFASYGLAFWYGSRLVREGTDGMNGGKVLIIILSMVSGSFALMQVPPNISSFATGKVASQKIFQTIDRSPEIDIDSKYGKRLHKTEGRISFHDVGFSYPTRKECRVLNGLNLIIESGKTIAFVGESGSGKSTVVHLIQRFYNPTEGTIRLDGTDVKELDLRWFRRQIGVVGQEPVLFNMSIRENLLLGMGRNVDQDELERVCKEANCFSFILQLSKGFDTIVGQRGGLLSGGQKQRIAIARALLRNPKILLLDEATSALDSTSERLVQDALDAVKRNRTTIVVAHRLSTIQNADQIVVMKNGSVSEIGNHEELYQRGGDYKKMIDKQQIKLSEEENREEDEIVESLELGQLKERESFDSSHTLQRSLPLDQNTSLLINTEEDDRVHIRKRTKGSVIWRVIRSMESEWYLLLFGCIGACLVGAVFPAYAYVFSQVVNVLNDPKNSEGNQWELWKGTNFFSVVFIGVGFLSFVGISMQIINFEIAGARYTKRLRREAFDAILKQEVGFFDREENTVGSIASSLALDAAGVNHMITQVWGDVLQLLFSGGIALAISFCYSWRLTLIVIGILPFITISTAIEGRIQQGFEDSTKEAYKKSGEIASEAISEIKTVKAMTCESEWQTRYENNLREPHQLALRKAFLSSMAYGAMQGFTMWANALGFYGGVRLIGAGLDTFPDVLVVVLCLTVTAGGMGRSSLFVPKYIKGKNCAVNVFSLLDRKTEINPDAPGSGEPIVGRLQFDRIRFHYPARPDIEIFRGEFNLQAESKMNVALVGASGCGKSTVVGLLQRWYDPNSGSVSVDGQAVEKYQLKRLREQMAVVGQEPILFDLTIRENIAYGLPEGNMTEEILNQAAEDANVHSFVRNLPDGFETRVGLRGGQLSGGQKQRIAIARALVGQPKILLLDEATSALDSESEKLVQNALDVAMKGRTTITIAHRLSTIQNADLICVVSEGRIKECGTHSELIVQSGLYKNMVEQQNFKQ